MRSKRVLATFAAVVLALAMGFGTAIAAEVSRMTTSDLNKRLGDTGLVVLDVRSPGDWQASELMVSGAIRKSPGAALAWAGEVDKGKTVVLYCA